MFSAFCLQNGSYFHTGSNSATREQCGEEIKNHLLDGSGFDEDECGNCEKASFDEIIEMFEVEIHEHNEPVTP